MTSRHRFVAIVTTLGVLVVLLTGVVLTKPLLRMYYESQLESETVDERLAALDALVRLDSTGAIPVALETLREDSSLTVKKAALRHLEALPLGRHEEAVFETIGEEIRDLAVRSQGAGELSRKSLRIDISRGDGPFEATIHADLSMPGTALRAVFAAWQELEMGPNVKLRGLPP